MSEQVLKPIPLIKRTFEEFSRDKAPRLGAALAYYSAFSIAPLLIIAIAVAGFVFGQEAAQGEIVSQFRSLLGETGASLVQTMIAEAYQPARGVIATLIGIVSLLLGATGAFNQLQQAMNEIWDVPAKAASGLMNTIRDRLLSLTMVFGTGFLLLTSLVLGAAVNALGRGLSGYLGPGTEALILVINSTVTLVLTTLIFAAIFRYLPDQPPKAPWSDLLFGAGLTAVLFTVGKFLIGLYLGNASLGSAYGAAGSLAIMLVWLYYSAQVFFLGAEFTKVYTRAKRGQEGTRLEDESSPQGQAPVEPHPIQLRPALPAPEAGADQISLSRPAVDRRPLNRRTWGMALLGSAFVAMALVVKRLLDKTGSQ
ncbi:MAG: YihY/virulence factor BrkB family protein [Anaerolineales bacterium]